MKSATFRPIVRPFTGRSLLWLAILFSVAGVAIRVAWLAVPWAVGTYMAPGAIHISQASHGGTCDGADVTVAVAERCEGRYACDIAIDFATDSAKTCIRNFAVSWTCGKASDFKLAVASNAGPTSKASIVCPDPREAAK
jgi:hypothetical protein